MIKQTSKLTLAWGLVAVLLLGLIIALAQPVGAQTYGTRATNLTAIDLDVQSSTIEAVDATQWGSGDIVTFKDGATPIFTIADGGATTLAGDLTVTGAINQTGDQTLSGDLTISDNFLISAQTAISVTDGGIITPTGTYQQLESAGTVTPTITTSGITTGTVLVLVNTANTTINIADSGTAKLSAAGALGQYDSLSLLFDGTNWIEVSRSDN